MLQSSDMKTALCDWMMDMEDDVLWFENGIQFINDEKCVDSMQNYDSGISTSINSGILHILPDALLNIVHEFNDVPDQTVIEQKNLLSAVKCTIMEQIKLIGKYQGQLDQLQRARDLVFGDGPQYYGQGLLCV